MDTKLRDALTAVREALELENNKESGPICDTIWMPDGMTTLFDFIDSALAQPAAEDSAHGHCAAWLRIFTHQHGRDPFPQEVWDAAQPADSTIYSPIETSPHAEKGGRHPNDNEPRDAERGQYLTQRGDDAGQGLCTYWKWGHAAGWNDHKRHSMRAQPAASGEAEEPFTWIADWAAAAISAIASGDVERQRFMHWSNPQDKTGLVPLYTHPPVAPEPPPIDMVLRCPACGLQHIDAPEANDQYLARSDPPSAWSMPPWKNGPHRSHLCHGCGHIWRPADVPTNGVVAVKTVGKSDSPIAAHPPVVPLTDAIPREVLEQLAAIHPVDEHDDNGPGRVVCPVCDAWMSMQWKFGDREDDASLLTHSTVCAADWARAALRPTPFVQPKGKT